MRFALSTLKYRFVLGHIPNISFFNNNKIIIIGIYIAPFPFIKCSKALHIGIVLVIVHNASMGEPEKVCFETLLEGLTRCRILQVLW